MLSSINIIVSKLGKMYGKIITNDAIRDIMEKTGNENITDAKVYKTTHMLKNKGYLVSVKKNHFLCNNPNKDIDEEDIIQEHYWELLRKHCQTFIQGGRYIGGIKALELHLQNYEIPDNIDIINLHKNAVEIIMFDKTVSYKTYTHKNNNIFSKVRKQLTTHKIGKFSFPCAHIELAILESLHNPSKIKLPLIQEYVKKIIKKHKKTLNLELFGVMISNNKHHVGMNRLYQISKSIDPNFAEKIHSLIKKYSFVMQAGK